MFFLFFSIDRNKYTDYVGTWGPAIVGHADDEVLDAIKVNLEIFSENAREKSGEIVPITP